VRAEIVADIFGEEIADVVPIGVLAVVNRESIPQIHRRS
jgi:hypothetical protein